MGPYVYMPGCSMIRHQCCIICAWVEPGSSRFVDVSEVVCSPLADAVSCDWLLPSSSAWEERRVPGCPHSLSSQSHRCIQRLYCSALPPGCCTLPALTGSMTASTLTFTNCLCALWSLGFAFHLHLKEPGYRHHKGKP